MDIDFSQSAASLLNFHCVISNSLCWPLLARLEQVLQRSRYRRMIVLGTTISLSRELRITIWVHGQVFLDSLYAKEVKSTLNVT